MTLEEFIKERFRSVSDRIDSLESIDKRLEEENILHAYALGEKDTLLIISNFIKASENLKDLHDKLT